MKSIFLGVAALAATTALAVYSPSFTNQSAENDSNAVCTCDCDCCLTSGCCLPGGVCECDFDCCGPECSHVSAKAGTAACCHDSAADEVATDAAAAGPATCTASGCCESGCCQTSGT